MLPSYMWVIIHCWHVCTIMTTEVTIIVNDHESNYVTWRDQLSQSSRLASLEDFSLCVAFHLIAAEALKLVRWAKLYTRIFLSVTLNYTERGGAQPRCDIYVRGWGYNTYSVDGYYKLCVPIVLLDGNLYDCKRCRSCAQYKDSKNGGIGGLL